MAKQSKSQPRKIYLLLFLAIFLFILSQLFTIYIQDLEEEMNFRVEELQKKIDALRYENIHFTWEIVKYESFTMIASEAAGLGFIYSDEIYLLK